MLAVELVGTPDARPVRRAGSSIIVRGVVPAGDVLTVKPSCAAHARASRRASEQPVWQADCGCYLRAALICSICRSTRAAVTSSVFKASTST